MKEIEINLNIKYVYDVDRNKCKLNSNVNNLKKYLKPYLFFAHIGFRNYNDYTITVSLSIPYVP